MLRFLFHYYLQISNFVVATRVLPLDPKARKCPLFLAYIQRLDNICYERIQMFHFRSWNCCCSSMLQLVNFSDCPTFVVTAEMCSLWAQTLRQLLHSWFISDPICADLAKTDLWNVLCYEFLSIFGSVYQCYADTQAIETIIIL